MEGHLHYRSDAGEITSLSLSKGSGFLGSDAQDAFHFPDLAPNHALLTWVAKSGGWQVKSDRESAPLQINGRFFPPHLPAMLSDGDVLVCGLRSFRFGKLASAPIYLGAAAQRIPLSKEQVLLGRFVPGSPATADRLYLDPDDQRLSREHAVITWAEGKHWLQDISKSGTTELNGQGAFGKRPLIVGDRIRILDYAFAYDGASLQVVPRKDGAAVKLNHVSYTAYPKGRPPVKIIQDVSLTIKPGEFVGILGGTGQGKTTLLKLMGGLLQPTAGTLLVNDVPLQLKDAAGLVGYVPQQDLVHPELSLGQALQCAASLRLEAPAEQCQRLVASVLERLGLQEHFHKKFGTEASGGQQKRASIGTELLTHPALLLLDEPSSGLDPYHEEELMILLQRLRHTGQTVICTTHVLNKAYLFDRILFVHQHKVIFSGTPQEAREYFLEHNESSGATGRNAPLERIYKEVFVHPTRALDWAQRYETSYAAEQAGETGLISAPRKVKPQIRRPNAWSVFRHLLHRQALLLRGDRLSLQFLLIQVIGIGILTGYAAESAGLRLFLVLLATVWFGCNNAGQAIVGERNIHEREQISGVGRHTYILSKFCWYGLITAVEGLTLALIARIIGLLAHGPILEDEGMPMIARVLRLSAIVLAALAGTGLGLAVSALCRSALQASLVIPLLMIPQVLLAGHVIARPEMPTPIRWFAQLWPSHSIQQIADVSSTYGRPLPWMTGKLRVPVFLQITMNGPENLNHRWDPWKDAQGYEKISEYNAAWRNLVVDMSLLAKEISSFAGKQKDPEPEASAQNNLDPEVEIRRVIIEELYHDAIEHPTTKEHAVRTISHVITPAFVSLQIVLLQIGLCYGLIYLGLRRSTGTRQASH